MPRFFNTAGPCDPARHYMIPPLRRLEGVRQLIDRFAYFVVRAPRQVGKTTSLIALARTLTAEGHYAAALVSMAPGSTFGDDIGASERAILTDWRAAARWLLPTALCPPPWPEAPAGHGIATALEAWVQAIDRPLVLFLDEIDSLCDQVLLSVLRQLHAGYPRRPEAFPASIALVGLRDVRDYKVSANENRRLGTASPFNIKEEAFTLRNFTRDEIAELYAQHTQETGQAFEFAVIERVYEQTSGQPWLVNALAKQMVDTLVPDRAEPITSIEVDRAREILIRRRDTHFDSLAERLREDRVRKVVEAIIAGDALPNMPPDDLDFVIDLGLVRRAKTGGLEIANPIYAELIPRSLVRPIDDSMGLIRPSWLTAEGKLDPDRLLEAFLAFWQHHGEALMGASPYHEIAPHLVMMAFLHRVENGGGKLHREFAIGSGRLDLLLEYADTRLPIELKVFRPGQSDPVKEGLSQLDTYLSGLGSSTGWLVVFDRRPKAKKAEKRVHATTKKSPAGHKVVVIRA